MSNAVEDRSLLMDEAHVTAKVAARLAARLAVHASRQRSVRRVVRALNLVVGVIVLVLSLLAWASSIATAIPDSVLMWAMVAAGSLLLADAILPSLLEEPNPDRFQDYSFYVHTFGHEIRQLETDSELSPEVWRARMRELIRIARTNIDDVFRKWPQFRIAMKQGAELAGYWDD